nr:ABC transporter permease subunit [Geminicoccus flavidas]
MPSPGWRGPGDPGLRAPGTSLKIAATCVIGAIVGEWIGANQGLGALIIQSTFNYQTDRLYAAVITSSTLGFLFFGIVVLAERLVMRRHPA